MAGGGAAPASPATSHRRRPRAQTRGGWLQTRRCDADTCGHVSRYPGHVPRVPGLAVVTTRAGCGVCRDRRWSAAAVSAVRCPLSRPRTQQSAAARLETSSHQQPPAALAPDIDGSSTRVRGVFSSRSFSDTLVDVTGGQVPRRRVTAAARRPPHSRPRPGRCSLGWARTGSAEVLSRTDRAAQLGPPPTPELTVS